MGIINVFKTLRVYASRWSAKSTRKFTAEEIADVVDAVVVSSRYGLSVQFTMAAGGMTFIPLDINSTLAEGEKVDLTKAELLTLERPGEADIFRVSI